MRNPRLYLLIASTVLMAAALGFDATQAGATQQACVDGPDIYCADLCFMGNGPGWTGYSKNGCCFCVREGEAL